MANYHLTPPTTLPSRAVQEAKEKRRKVLDAAEQTRKANYHQFLHRMARMLGKKFFSASVEWDGKLPSLKRPEGTRRASGLTVR